MSQSPMSASQRSAFAKKINGLMLDRGWNASELARQATKHLPPESSKDGISRQDISKYLSGRVAPSPVSLKAIADALRVEANSLFRSAAMPTVRSPAQVAQGVAEEASVRQLSPDTAWISINQAVPWPVALKIMELLKGNR